MSKPRIFLAPGEYWFGVAQQDEIVTVLGSCVAVVLWHPASCFLALSHYLLPVRPAPHHDTMLSGMGYYGEQILPFLIKQAALNGITAATLKGAIIGGAESIATQALASPYRVGVNNVNFAQQFLFDVGIKIQQQDVGGIFARKLIVKAADGCVQISVLDCG
ncbi:chemotaxis protein CheD [Alishewanella longhuensis]